jgi:hypothetical protein
MSIPKEIGSCIQIANNYDLRREFEARGFWPETITPQHCIMRRDYADGVLETA